MRPPNLRPLLGGLKSLVAPNLGAREAALPSSARYGYAVWLRHLSLLAAQGQCGPFDTVVELGPGRSLAASLAALLGGSERCLCLDEVPLATPAANVAALDELVALYAAAAPIPGDGEFPALRPTVPSTSFPGAAIPAATRAWSLRPERVARIREALLRPGTPDAPIRYVAPWTPADVVPGSVDLVFSQAVLQELSHPPEGNELEETVRLMHQWLRPGGVMSHQVDLAFYLGGEWNAHWAMGDLSWRVLRGRRPSWINRAPLSVYLDLCRRHGFDVVAVQPVLDAGGVAADRLKPRFRGLAAEDYITRSMHLIARRR